MNVPKLRFKEFNDEYKTYKFYDVAKLCRGSSPRPIINFITKSEDCVNWIKIGDVSPNETYINSTSEKITKEGAKKSRRVYKGEIILSNSMSFGRPYILNLDGCIHDGWFVVRDYEKLLNKEYLYHFMCSPLIQKQYKTLSTGGVVSNISSELVYSVKLNISSKEEQLKIAKFLSLLDKKIELQSKKIEDLKLFKSSQIINFFNKNNFAEVYIKNIGFFQSGNSLSKDCLTSSGVPIILYGDLYTKYNEVIKKVEQYTNDNKKYVKSKQNQIIFPTSTTVNSLSLISPSSINLDGIIYGGDILILNLNKDVNADFLSYEINHYKKKEFSKIAQGSTIIHIHAEDLLNCKIALPNIVLQDKFALTFNKLNQKIELENNKLNKLQKLKKGLMQSMFV